MVFGIMTRMRRVCAAALAATALGFATTMANADDLKIRSPIIDFHELEFENNFVIGSSKTTVHELEYGFTQWLKLGVEAETAADPGQGFHYDATAVEGFLQLTPQGKYWADLGFFAELENPVRRGDARNLTIGPLIQKQVPLFGLDTLHSINLLFTKDLGESSVGPPSMLVAARSLALLNPHFEPGVEYYGSFTLGAHGPEPEYRAGPAFAGVVGFRELGINTPGGIRYDAAYLRGLNGAAEPNAVRFRVEFEFPL